MSTPNVSENLPILFLENNNRKIRIGLGGMGMENASGSFVMGIGTGGNMDIETTGNVVFNNLPTCSDVPSSANQLVNKTYVDGIVGGASTIAVSDTNSASTFYPTLTADVGSGQTIYADKTTTPFSYVPSTSTLTATNFSGLASNATQVAVNNNNANLTHYLNFTDNHTTGQYALQATTGISCNPNTSTITATTFSGALSGNATTATTATNATNVATTSYSTGGTQYIAFVGATTGNNPVRIDTDLTYDASTNVMAFSALPTCPVVPTTSSQLVNKAYVDSVEWDGEFDDFTAADGSSFNWNFTGAGTSSFFNGVFDATLASVGNRRIGLLNLNTGGTGGNNCFAQSSNAVYSPNNILSMTFGFIPLGNGSLSAVGTDAGNIYQAFGIAQGTSSTSNQTPATLWRLSSGSTTIPTWQLVENNVVKETLSGTNLTGGLTNKWCRASIVFTNNGANYYGTFTNLTDGATYTTATYATTAGNITDLQQIYLHTGTANTTAKQIAFDYLDLNTNALPIGTSNLATTSR